MRQISTRSTQTVRAVRAVGAIALVTLLALAGASHLPAAAGSFSALTAAEPTAELAIACSFAYGPPADRTPANSAAAEATTTGSADAPSADATATPDANQADAGLRVTVEADCSVPDHQVTRSRIETRLVAGPTSILVHEGSGTSWTRTLTLPCAGAYELRSYVELTADDGDLRAQTFILGPTVLSEGTVESCPDSESEAG